VILRASVVIFSLSGCLVSSSISMAQQNGSRLNDAPHVSTTEYRPLTLWDKIRIGGAYFTDPSYVRTVRIAYGFSTGDIAQDQIANLVKDGKAVPATIDPKTGKALPVGNFTWQDGSQGMVLLSDSATLLGQPHSSVWLTHEAASVPISKSGF
jgi:hypothetical protein